MENIIEEGEIKGAIDPASLLQTKTILTPMEKSVCKITGDKCGTGFFCKIELNKVKIPVLITNYHIINDKMIENERDVKIKLGNEPILKVIKLNKRRRIYSSNNEKLDIMILEIFEKDDLKDINYLEIDDYLLTKNSELSYEDSSIYILHYPSASDVKVSYGYGIQTKNQYNIIHKCKTLNGSSGAPILNLLSNKVIGIHKSFVVNNENNKENKNHGTSLKYVLIDMHNKISIKKNQKQFNRKNLSKKPSMNCFKEKNNTNTKLNNEKEKKGKIEQIANIPKKNLKNDFNGNFGNEHLQLPVNKGIPNYDSNLSMIEKIKNNKDKTINDNSNFFRNIDYTIKKDFNKTMKIEKHEKEKETIKQKYMANLNINNEIKKSIQLKNNIFNNMKRNNFFFNSVSNNNISIKNHSSMTTNIKSEKKNKDKDKPIIINNYSTGNKKYIALYTAKRNSNCYQNSRIIQQNGTHTAKKNSNRNQNSRIIQQNPYQNIVKKYSFC